ncbi:unnamed protein product [Durusdinium trenchii]|uniref:Uncharacterized protein n=1 Tax=Durusdinium trenchii TaxID=1381693 RepID=A0ABP0SVB0_9DINO
MACGAWAPRPPPPPPNGRTRPRPRAIEPLSSASHSAVEAPARLNERPHTHDGVLADKEAAEEGETERPERFSCSSCGKLRLKLEHAERARVKAQEQLVRIQQENVRMRQTSGYAGGESGGVAADEEVARTLESYRREVAFLKQSLAEQKELEVQLREELQRLRHEHAERMEQVQGQMATLLLDLTEAEAGSK